MKYLFLLHSPDDGVPSDPTSREYSETFRGYGAVEDEMRKAGVLQECFPLGPASTATTVRVRDGETLLTDGPAAEIKEQVGGYTLLECADLDEALRWAAKFPAATIGSVEVRTVLEKVAPPA
jgi:hypothetical protein